MKKLTQKEVLQRIEERNVKYPDKQVWLYPKKQQYLGNDKPLQFKCFKNHKFTSTLSRIMSGRGCPHCKKIQERFKKRKPFSEVVQLSQAVHGDIYRYEEQDYVNYTSFMNIYCTIHKKKFKCTPYNHIKKGQKCPDCKRDEFHNLYINKANEVHKGIYDYSLVTKAPKSTNEKIDIICKIHGVFKQRPSDHLRGHGCPKCARTSVSRKQIYWLQQIEVQQNIKIQHAGNGTEFHIPGTTFRVDGFCVETNTVYEFHGDAFHGNPKRYNPDDHCHPFNNKTAKELYEKTVHQENIIKSQGFNLVVMWESDFDNIYPNFNPKDVVAVQGRPLTYHTDKPPEELLEYLKIQFIDKEFGGFRAKQKYRCLLCGDTFLTTLTQRKQAYRLYGSVGCPSCSRNRQNNTDNLLKIQQKLGGRIVDDVLLLPNNIGIFVQTLKENTRTSITMLKMKYQLKGIRLIILFSDELTNNEKLVINKISHYMKVNNTSTIHARKCVIREIDKKMKSEFLKANHIQGNDNAQISLGAFYEDRLVAVMTFTKPRVALGYKNKDRSTYNKIWELSRFATDISIRIPGIASKLLKHFQRNHEWSKIISYADRRWSDGNLYEVLGFELEATNPPDYFYVIDGIRKHRWNYRKDILKHKLPGYDPDKTEYQNMKDAGYWRVWDCGTYRYILKGDVQ